MKIKLVLIISLILFIGMAAPAFATLFSFENITNNNSGDAAIGEAQLGINVEKYGEGQVSFTFFNRGSEDSSITDIYFEDYGLLTSFDFFGSSGVDFEEGATPPNLPGGNVYSFNSIYSWDSTQPVQPNGINPGESLAIIFDFNTNTDFDSLIAAIENGTLRIGIHVQGFDSGGSESFISPAPVPEPATLLLLGTGLFGLAGFSRKKFPKRNS